jgi:hypothetical protein
MKKLILGFIASLLCVAWVAEAGTHEENNPSQAGQSSIYFYDLAASDTHGKGKLMVDLDNHTFVFNGQGFTPSAQIKLSAKAAASSGFVVFATGKATESGNLHVAGSWVAGATPLAVAASYETISTFGLFNWGGFVVHLACYYSTDGGVTWVESVHGEGVAIGGFSSMDFEDLGLPEGALVRIHAVVVGGKDRTGEVYQYSSYPLRAVNYEIAGTAWNPILYIVGYWP